jgi:hypothetical protein
MHPRLQYNEDTADTVGTLAAYDRRAVLDRPREVTRLARVEAHIRAARARLVDLELDEARPLSQRRFDPASTPTAIAACRTSLDALERSRVLLQRLIRSIDERSISTD